MKWRPVVSSQFLKLWELVALSVFFLVMLFVIFSKGRLERYVADEKDKNPQFALIYLRELDRIRPSPEFKLMIAKTSLQLGHYEDAERYIKEIDYTALKEEDLIDLYFILKRLYFDTKNKDYYAYAQKVLKALQTSSSLKTLELVYREAIDMAMPSLALSSSLRISSLKKNKDILWLERTYKHALELKNYTLAKRYLEYLIEEDKARRAYWLREYYNLAMAMEDTKLALEVLINLYTIEPAERERIKQSIAWLLLKSSQNPELLLKEYMMKHPYQEMYYMDILATLYRAKKAYKKAFEVYSVLYEKVKDPREKALIYKNIIGLLLEAKDYNTLKDFIERNYVNHLDNLELLKLTLRASLATGDPSFAYKIAKDIAGRIK